MKKLIRNITGIAGSIMLILAMSTENIGLMATLGIIGIALMIPTFIHLYKEDQKVNGNVL